MIDFTLILNILRTVVDIALVWFVLYLLLAMIRQNMRTLQLFKGVLFIIFLKLITSALGLGTSDYIVDTILTWGFLALVVVFQPEIRSTLEKIGQTKLHYQLDDLSTDEKVFLIDEIVDAITTLSEQQVGALITFEKSQSLIDYINTGTRINGDIRSELFRTIFWEGTPLHDGAVIIKNDKIICAAAFYPPSTKELSPLYGARHRAALGISEVSDSLTIVVSEETGTISFASNGMLRKIPRKELKMNLITELGWLQHKGDDVYG